jgi:etoposide-induced 2.4 mRNA
MAMSALERVLSAAFREFCGGVQHAVSLHRILLFFLNSRLICVSSAKCFVLNGLIFLGSIFFFDRAVIPVIHLFGEILQRSFAQGPSQAEDVRDRVDGFVFLLYQALWMYPIYCISFILNTIWYQEIADDAYLQLHGKPNPTPVADMIRDELYRAILVAFFLLQTVLSYLIPVVGPVASFIHLGWLYSLYCFEYKWSLAGWSLEKRLAHLEQNWAYFAGFGSPFTLATFFVPNFVSKGIFALLFPVFLLLAIACDPVSESDDPSRKLPIFRFSRWWSLQLLRRIGKATGVQTKKQKATAAAQKERAKRAS